MGTEEEGGKERGKRGEGLKEERNRNRGRGEREPLSSDNNQDTAHTRICSVHTLQLMSRYGEQACSITEGALILPDPPPRCNANHHTNNKGKRAVRMESFTTERQLLGTYFVILHNLFYILRLSSDKSNRQSTNNH